MIFVYVVYVVWCRKGRFPMPKWNRTDTKSSKRKPKWSPQKSKLAKGRPKMDPGEEEWSRCEEVSKKGASSGTKLEPFLLRIDKNNIPKTILCCS